MKLVLGEQILRCGDVPAVVGVVLPQRGAVGV
jgi:hypothetical protein